MQYGNRTPGTLGRLQIIQTILQQQQPFLLLLLNRLLFTTMKHSVIFIHHPQDLYLVRVVERRNRNVPHGSELTAVVQVLVFQTEEVPNKPTEDFQRGQDGGHKVVCHISHFGRVKGQGPYEAEE